MVIYLQKYVNKFSVRPLLERFTTPPPPPPPFGEFAGEG